MRGLQTPVRAIRRQVFTEVAKLGFKANAETLVADMEAIPYEIVGEDSEVKYRESIYRARAVVRCARDVLHIRVRKSVREVLFPW